MEFLRNVFEKYNKIKIENEFEDKNSFETFQTKIKEIKTIGVGEYNEARLYQMNNSWKKLEKNQKIVLRINKTGTISDKEIQFTKICSQLKLGPELYYIFKIDTMQKKWLKMSRKIKNIEIVTKENEIDKRQGPIFTFATPFNTENNIIKWKNQVFKRIPYEIILVSQAFEGDISVLISNPATEKNKARIKKIAKNIHDLCQLSGKYGFFHGDIKAKNLLFFKSEVVMTDFDPKFCLWPEKEFNPVQICHIMILLLIIELRCQYTPPTPIPENWEWPLASELVETLLVHLSLDLKNLPNNIHEPIVNRVIHNIRMYGIDEDCLNIDGLIENESLQWKYLEEYAKTGVSTQKVKGLRFR